jgi:hypothetical protein
MEAFLCIFTVPLLFHFYSCILAQSTATNSIFSYPDYNLQRDCVKVFLWGSPSGGALSINLGCSAPWLNNCFCRADLAPAASSFLTKCATFECPGGEEATVDIAAGVSVYNKYCSEAVAAQINTPPSQTTTSNSQPEITVIETLTPITTAIYTSTRLITIATSSSATSPTATRPSPNGAPSGGGDGGGGSSSNKIALGVGLGIGIPTLVATNWMCFIAIVRKRSVL